MSKIHFVGASRVFIRLQIKAKRLDLVMVWPRVEALSWACVSGRIWQPHTLQASFLDPDELSQLQKACLDTSEGLGRRSGTRNVHQH